MKLQVFALGTTLKLGQAIAEALGQPLTPLEEREFEDGEHKARPLETVRGADVYVVQSLHGGPDESPNDKLCRLLFFIGALKTNGAARVTAIVPYLAYARKDRQTKARDPLTSRYVAQLFEAVGLDRIVAIQPHNVAAFQNAFRCEAIALDIRGILLERAAHLAGKDSVTVASPDPGGVRRAQLFREALQERLGRPVGFVMMEKRRSGGVISGSIMAGDVDKYRVLLVDDMIASGGTMIRAARALRQGGATDVLALAVHGLFTEGAITALSDSAISGWIVSDTVPPFRLKQHHSEKARIDVVSAAPLLANAIRQLHEDRAIIGLPAAGA